MSSEEKHVDGELEQLEAQLAGLDELPSQEAPSSLKKDPPDKPAQVNKRTMAPSPRRAPVEALAETQEQPTSGGMSKSSGGADFPLEMRQSRVASKPQPPREEKTADEKTQKKTKERVPSPIPMSLQKLGVKEIPPVESFCAGKNEGCEGEGMDPFYKALSHVKKRGKVRIMVYGDSMVMGDLIVSTLRERLQKAFGNAGPGLILPVKPCKWYGIDGARTWNSKSWKVYRVTQPHISDGLYGIAGQTAQVTGAGHKARIRCEDDCRWSDITSYDIFYLANPDAGALTITLPQADVTRTLEMDAEMLKGAVESIRTAPFELDLEIQTDSGTSRIFGVAAESDGPGVVVDSISILGSRSYRLNNIDSEHFSNQLRLRNPDLVILMFGANESENEHVSYDSYKKELKTLVRTVKRGIPNGSILMTSPPARGERSGGRIRVKPVISELIEVQKEVCREEGIAYWNEHDAMGGEDGPSAWFKHRPRLLTGDLVHFSRSGASLMGKLLYAAILQGYLDYRQSLAH